MRSIDFTTECANIGESKVVGDDDQKIRPLGRPIKVPGNAFTHNCQFPPSECAAPLLPHRLLFDRHPLQFAGGFPEIPYAVMLGRAIIPESHRAFAPFESY